MIEKNQRVQISRTFKNGKTETFEARVKWVELRPDFQYFGYTPVLPGTEQWDHNRGHWGTERAYTLPDKPAPQYAATVTIIGPAAEPKPARRWYPKPGDRGYDLMC